METTLCNTDVVQDFVKTPAVKTNASVRGREQKPVSSKLKGIVSLPSDFDYKKELEYILDE